MRQSISSWQAATLSVADIEEAQRAVARIVGCGPRLHYDTKRRIADPSPCEVAVVDDELRLQPCQHHATCRSGRCCDLWLQWSAPSTRYPLHGSRLRELLAQWPRLPIYELDPL